MLRYLSRQNKKMYIQVSTSLHQADNALFMTRCLIYLFIYLFIMKIVHRVQTKNKNKRKKKLKLIHTVHRYMQHNK